MNDFFQTRRTFIRPYKNSDANAAWLVLKRREIYENTYAIPKDFPRELVLKWFAYLDRCRKDKTAFEFGIFDKFNNKYIGNCGIINVHKNLHRGDITYFINPSLHNKGYATEVGSAMLMYAFKKLGLTRVGGTCLTSNLASRRVMQKLGFKFEGTGRAEIIKDNKIVDLDHFSILFDEYSKILSKVSR